MREGISHPILGKWRDLPPRSKNAKNSNWIGLRKVNFRNLKNINIDFPIGCLSVCCGISGSGKSSLVRGFIHKAVKESIKENRSVRAICERKFSDFVHGPGILNQRTGKKEFIIDKKVVDDPDKELSQWVVESFGKQQDS